MNNNIYKIAILILSLIFVIALLSSCYSASDSEKSFTLSPTGTTKEEHFIPATSYPSNPSVTSYRYPVPTYQDTPLLNSESGQPEKVTFEGTGIIIGELFSATNKTGIPKTMFFLIKALDDERQLPVLVMLILYFIPMRRVVSPFMVLNQDFITWLWQLLHMIGLLATRIIIISSLY